ncbi:MAG: S8 family serine peptidase [candidate division Zixibacteria bacterium]|nr:S8 family serine peptidase [candidate division Zixibacteria bacterium]
MKILFKTWPVLAVILCTLAVLCQFAQAEKYEPRPVPGRFIVKIKDKMQSTAVSQAAGRDYKIRKLAPAVKNQNLKSAENLQKYYIVHRHDPNLTREEVLAALGPDNVEYIEPDYYLDFYAYPDDSLFSHQWYLHNTGQDYYGIKRNQGDFNDSLILKRGTPGKDINLAPFYDNPPSETTRVVVAVIDTGTDLFHPELRGRLWKNPDEIPFNNIDDDHNGYVDDTLGFDISGDSTSLYDIVGDNDPSDFHGHGTHIAGIIAANQDGKGVVGVAPWAEIMSVKVRPNATTAVGAAGMIYAVDAGAQILNISWGTPFESYILREAVLYAHENGVLVCVAAGNSGFNDDLYPGSYPLSFTVAAGNSDGYMADFSTWGSQIDLIAPGLDILSLRAQGYDMYAEANEPGVRIIGSDSLYYLSDGTSMASPVVVGAAALLWSLRPDMNLEQLENILQLGAIDLIDPRNIGDSLPGPDSVGGFGYLNIAASYDLLVQNGLYIIEPLNRNRYSGSLDIRIAPVAGYSGNWELAYSVGLNNSDWQFLASGSSLPGASVAFIFDRPDLNNIINLRLTDKYNHANTVSFTYVNDNVLTISSPATGDSLKYYIPLRGSVYGPDYKFLTLFYKFENEQPVELLTETSEFFDTLIYNWNISGLSAGLYTIVLTGEFDGSQLRDSVMVDILSTFAAGWPQKLPGRASLTAACADLDNDNFKEIIVGTSYGLNVFRYDGEPLEGFPVLINEDTRCIPAVYDVDRDGYKDIIITTEEGIHVFKRDGSYAPGWPRSCPTGFLSFGYPTPTVTRLSADQDSVIIIVNDVGDVYAFELNGDSYFYSLEGYFTSFNQQPSGSFYYGGNSVTSADLTGNNINEAVVSYSSSYPYAGVGLFESRSGLPAFNQPLPYVLTTSVIYGMVLGDLTGDHLPEIIANGYDNNGTRTIWALSGGKYILPGWPVTLPNVTGWLSTFPMVADLDLDKSPEILCTYFEFDIASLYIFRADGSPYIQIDGRPAGEAFHQPVTFGVPIVADLLGDQHPEIIIRSGYIFPGTGPERLYVLDYTGHPVPGWPIETPTRNSMVFSTPFAPLVDDIDSDGKVEMILIGDANDIYIWDFETDYRRGKNSARLFMDNHNSLNLATRDIITDITEPDKPSVLPTGFQLAQNYPNPFNPRTMIEFSLPVRSNIKLEIYNILGQKVTTLLEQPLKAGTYKVDFDGSNYASGIYFYRLKTDDYQLTRKMMLLK